VAKREPAVKDAQLIAAGVELSDDAIIGGTLEGIVLSWNPAAERIFGYSSKEIIGKTWSLLAAERVSEMDAVLVRVKDGEIIDHLETTLARKDGTAVPVALTVAPTSTRTA